MYVCMYVCIPFWVDPELGRVGPIMNLSCALLNFVQHKFGPSDFLLYLLYIHTYIHTYLQTFGSFVDPTDQDHIPSLRGKERTGLSPTGRARYILVTLF